MSLSPTDVFTVEWLEKVFPAEERTNAFFDALFGDAEEGAYTISLRYVQSVQQQHEFAFDLRQRTGRCLVCSLTYGLPQVFSRHPVIDAKGIAAEVAAAIEGNSGEFRWCLEPTVELSSMHHVIPFVILVA